MAKVSRGAREAVEDYIRNVYNPYRLLSRFFLDVSAFRQLQARTASLIAGYSALHFFDHTLYPSDPLEVYVHFQHRREVVDWLVTAGFAFVPSYKQSPDLEFTVTEGYADEIEPSTPWLCGVLTFASARGDRPITIRVMISANTPMELILHTHSSEPQVLQCMDVPISQLPSACMINVISYEKAYCLFPRATLHKRRSLLTSCLRGGYIGSARDIAAIHGRGYEMVDGLNSEEICATTTTSTFVLGWRWIDDCASWVINFDTTDIFPKSSTCAPSLPLTHDPVAVCGFSLRYNIGTKASISFVVLEGPLLRYSYTLGEPDLANRLTIALCSRSPVWAGKFWDEELRGICKQAILGAGNFSELGAVTIRSWIA
ncbi:hypothetical protein C8Q79DRAFT_1005980 [Trametes meyenii]|nr:hypothetical protein C8Q79DRAFT_1005980 [Trametes meyenii]